MNLKQSVTCLSLLLPLFAALPLYAEKGANLRPKLLESGSVLLAETFAISSLSQHWHSRTGNWNVREGSLIGRKPAAEKHPAKLDLKQPWGDGMLSFSFRVEAPGGLDLDLSIWLIAWPDIIALACS